jgi:hypothetical protein
VVVDKTRRGHNEVGRAVVNLDQVVEACEVPHLKLPAYACFLCPSIAPSETDEEYVARVSSVPPRETGVDLLHEGARESAAPSARAGCAEPGQVDEGLGRLILRMERLPDASLLSVALREGDPEGLQVQTMTTGSTYVPKFQRAVMELTTFAQSLFDQFEEVDGRGDFDEPFEEQEHTLSAQAFENLLVYLGVLDPVLSVVEDASSCLVALSDLGEKVGKMTRLEAAELFKKRSQIEHARAPTASQIRRDSAPPERAGKKEKEKRHEMTRAQFEACLAAMIEMLQDKAAKANHLDPFGPLPPEKKKTPKHKRPADDDDDGRKHVPGGGKPAATNPESSGAPAGVAANAGAERGDVKGPERGKGAGGGGEGVKGMAGEGERVPSSPLQQKPPQSFRSVIKTPVGRFIRIRCPGFALLCLASVIYIYIYMQYLHIYIYIYMDIYIYIHIFI